MSCRKATLIKGFDLCSTCKTCHWLFLFEMQSRVRVSVSLFEKPEMRDWAYSERNNFFVSRQQIFNRRES